MEALYRLFVGVGPNEGELAPPDRRRILLRVLLAAEIVVLVAACVLVVVRPSVGLHWDFANYYDAGRKVLAGQVGDLYDEFSRIGGRKPQSHMPFASTPITAYLHAPMALLSPPAALVAFKLSGLATSAAALWLLWRRIRSADADGLRLAVRFLAAVILFQPLWAIYPVGGQVTPWIFLLLVAGWLSHERGRFWMSAACFVFAVSLKPFLAPGLVFLVLVSGWRFAASTAVVGAAAASLSIAVAGWPVHQEFLARMAGLADLQKSFWRHAGFASVLDAALITFEQLKPGAPRPRLAADVQMGLRLSIAGVFLAFALDMRSWRPAARRNLAFLLAMALPVLVAPIAWAHYLVFFFPLLAWAVARSAQLPMSGRALLALVFLACIQKNRSLSLGLVDWIGTETKAQVVTIGAINSLAITLILIFLVAYWRPLAATVREEPRA